MSRLSKDPSQQLDLRDPAVRRHFADALPVVVRILGCWKVRREDQAILLGLSLLSLRRHLQGATLDLSETNITRMSLISGIYQDLHRIYPVEIADAWFNRRNDAAPFFGHTPLAYACKTGLSGLVDIRRGLAAAVHGNFQSTPEDRRRASLIPQPDIHLGPERDPAD
ncbi:hypothetical protein [Deinococcus sp. UYEF24]